MFLKNNCTVRSFIASSAIGLVVAFAGTSFAAPDIVAYIPAQNLPSANDENLGEVPSNSSLFTWHQTDSRERSYLALLETKASHEAGQTLRPALSWETGKGKSYLIPALEIPGFIVLLNAFDRLAFPHKIKEGRRAYNTTPSTIWEHLHRQNWHFDRDSFEVNQLGHPYQGATMYGLARSSGLGFWESALYSNAGSFLWEMAGETTRPSVNDQITTGNAGALFGEALFRMANLVLEDGGGRPDGWHELAAAAISPPTGFNRLVFGDRLKSVYPSHKPATFWRFMLGSSRQTSSRNLTTAEDHDTNAVADFSMAYGLPGKQGYTYHRPLDYFNFDLETRARARNFLEAVTLRGLLIGTDYQVWNDYRGVWGLYGSYDYISPRLFRVSSTALSLGSTGQYWMAPGVALQGSLLGGFGFGAAGADTESIDGRGFHYGGTPQGLLALGLIFGDRVMLDVTGRSYYVSKWIPDQTPGPELVLRGNAGITVRIAGNHAVSISYAHSIRETYYHNFANQYHTEGTVNIFYTYLSNRNFGAVEWRNTAER